MILHLHLTEDHLKLVRALNIEDNDDEVLTLNKGIMLCIQSHLLDDVAMVLGLTDKAIKNTENDALGRAYPDDIENYMVETYNYVSNNLYLIETLLHQNVFTGIKPGHYKAKDNEMIWEYCGDDAEISNSTESK